MNVYLTGMGKITSQGSFCIVPFYAIIKKKYSSVRFIVKILFTVLVSFAAFNTYSQDTIVHIDNSKLVGQIINQTAYSVVIEIPNANGRKTQEVGKHLIAYIYYEKGNLEKFKYSKWKTTLNDDPEFNKGFYFSFNLGYSSLARAHWGTDILTNEFYIEERKTYDQLRIGSVIGNQWFNLKRDNYAFGFGVDWLRMSFKPDKVCAWNCNSDWHFVTSFLNPSIINTFKISNSWVIDQSLGGGYMFYWSEETSGFSLQSGLKFRNRKLVLGPEFSYARTKDSVYGYPITLTTISFSIGLKM